MQITPLTFDSFESLPPAEGIVLLGAGGDLNDWVNGVTDLWNKEGLATGKPEDLFSRASVLTTTGGRTDLALEFKPGAKLEWSKLVVWRILFGDCSWISDYLVNYEADHQAPVNQDFS